MLNTTKDDQELDHSNQTKRRRSQFESRHSPQHQDVRRSRRRHKREKNDTTLEPPTLTIINDELDQTFFVNANRHTNRSDKRMCLVHFAFAVFVGVVVHLCIQPNSYSPNLIISQVDALDQNDVLISNTASMHENNHEIEKKSAVRSVVDQIIAGGNLQSLFTQLEKSNNAKHTLSTSSTESKESHQFQKQVNYLSSKRGELYFSAIENPVIDIESHNEVLKVSPNQDSDLKGKCSIFTDEKAGSYWTYEWCHEDFVVQYHKGPGEQVHPLHNTGKYAGEIRKGVHIYERGDKCGGQGPFSTKKRSTHIIFECCNEENANKESDEDIYIRKMEEKVICEYVLYVCRPAACSWDNVQENTTNVHPDAMLDSHDNHFASMPTERVEQNKRLIKKMFSHAYDSYMYNAHPAGELRPLSCKAGTFDLVKLKCLTLIDTLDTLLIFGNYTEFARSVERLRFEDNVNRSKKNRRKKEGGGLFDADQNVSVFETNIRVLGGLLSAHQLALASLKGKHHIRIPLDHVLDINGKVLIGEVPKNICPDGKSEFWEYDDFLLKLAEDLGYRLLPSFETNSGIPFGTVNLRHGVPKGETSVASLAGGGTLSLEMELLSRLTGNSDFGKAAKLATRALWIRRSPLTSLLGKHIDVNSGKWKETLSGIGSNSDSFYEYLLKHYILFGDEDFWLMFVDAYDGIMKYVKIGDWYGDVDMTFPQTKKKVMESLQAFWPGIQILLGELVPAAKTLNSYFLVREELGFLPERFHFEEWKVDTSGKNGAGRHPLRPELLESAYLMHRALHSSSPSSGWQWAMDFSLTALQQMTWTECGYAAVKSVRGDRNKRRLELDDEMPSFFLSETLKYLYLIFDDDNFIHQDDGKEWVFTTEAHPIHFEPETLMRKKDVEEEDILSLLSNKKIEKSTATAPIFQRQGHQQWAVSTKESDFLTQINKIDHQYEPKGNVSLMHLFYGPNHYSNKTQEKMINSMDLPKLHFYPLGRESSIPKSCTNYYHSSLDWIHALNGEAGLEYEKVYHSILTNDYDKDQMLSPYRSQYKKLQGEEICDISEEIDNESEAVKSLQVSGTFSNRFDMGDLGYIDITAYDEGFFASHVNSNESIEVSSVSNEAPDKSPMFLIRTSTGLVDRMIMADNANNAFKCEVLIKYNQDTDDDGKSGEKILAKIPCSPALFGPLELSKLTATGGLITEGILVLPPEENREGCLRRTENLHKGLENKEENTIRMIMRGECSFHEKAILQKQNYNAKGVLVINTEPGQLFVMDRSEGMEGKVNEEPATVLITHEHGRQLIKNFKKKKTAKSRYYGSIEMSRVQSNVPSRDDGASSWPLVESTEDTMQVLSKSNWGVHAKRITGVNGKKSWQLYIMKHSFNLDA